MRIHSLAMCAARGCLAATVLLSAACGSNLLAPTAPPSSGSAVATAFEQGHGTADLASCLAGARNSGCFGGSRMKASAGAAVTSAPIALTAAVSGSTVILSWTPPPIQDHPVTSYIVEAGGASGQANLASYNTGTSQVGLTVPGVPAGTFFIRIRAVNSSGTSAASNEVIVTVGGTVCASAPQNLTGSSSGSSVSLFWSPPASGTALSYALGVGSAPGQSDLAAYDTGSTALTFATSGVPFGSYYMRIYARSSCGFSAASNEIRLTVGTAPAVDLSGTWTQDFLVPITHYTVQLRQSGTQIAGTVHIQASTPTNFSDYTITGVLEPVTNSVTLRSVKVVSAPASYNCSSYDWTLQYAAGAPATLSGLAKGTDPSCTTTQRLILKKQ